MTPLVRTVLGDIAPTDLGVCYAHEHLIIDPGFVTATYPDLRLESVENGITELRQFHADGGRAMVDSMPCDAGRNVEKLAAISRETGVHILCPTGVHLSQYYDAGHWSHRYTVEQLTHLFIADLEQGIDRHDYGGPLVERTPHRAGLIKVATGGIGPDEREQRIFAAAAAAHRETGAPILTHTEKGAGGMEQVAFFQEHGVDLGHVVISHTDRLPDPAYHRGLLASGVRLEYDSGFRWPGPDNPTLDLLAELIEEFPRQLMLGMDAARSRYWTSYGGAPGLSFLLTSFTDALRKRGISDTLWQYIFIKNPAETYAFAERNTS